MMEYSRKKGSSNNCGMPTFSIIIFESKSRESPTYPSTICFTESTVPAKISQSFNSCSSIVLFSSSGYVIGNSESGTYSSKIDSNNSPTFVLSASISESYNHVFFVPQIGQSPLWPAISIAARISESL